MDWANAGLLVAIAAGLVELGKALMPADWKSNPRILAATVTVASFAATFALRYSVWAHEQVIGGKAMDDLGIGSLIVVAVALAAAETAVYLGLRGGAKAVSAVGENPPWMYDPGYGKPVPSRADKKVVWPEGTDATAPKPGA